MDAITATQLAEMPVPEQAKFLNSFFKKLDEFYASNQKSSIAEQYFLASQLNDASRDYVESIYKLIVQIEKESN